MFFQNKIPKNIFNQSNEETNYKESDYKNEEKIALMNYEKINPAAPNVPQNIVNSLEKNQNCSTYMPMPKLAQAYIPFQYINTIFPPMDGLKKGTIFPELHDPY